MGTLQRLGIAAFAAALVACSGTTSSTPTTADDGVPTTGVLDGSPEPTGTAPPTGDGVFTSPEGMQARFPSEPTAEPAQIPTQRDARIEAPDDFFVRALMLVDPAGPTLYQAQVVGSADYVDGPAATAFLDSITILG